MYILRAYELWNCTLLEAGDIALPSLRVIAVYMDISAKSNTSHDNVLSPPTPTIRFG